MIKEKWLSLPPWFRKTLVESLESITITLIVYWYNVVVNHEPVDVNVALALSLKTVAKVIRSHPEIPIPDYVNNQK